MTIANPLTIALAGYSAPHARLAVAGAVATIMPDRPQHMETEDLVRAYRAFADRRKPVFEDNSRMSRTSGLRFSDKDLRRCKRRRSVLRPAARG